jgi:hypothetical protein
MNSFNYKCLSEVPNYLMQLVKEQKPIDEQHTITIYEVNNILNDLFPKDEDKWPCQDSGLDRMD